MKQSFADSINEKVETAVGPLRSKQSEIVSELASTGAKVANLDSDHQATKSKVVNLELEVSNLRKELHIQDSTSGLRPPTVTLDYAPQSKPQPTGHINRESSSEIQVVISNAKKILGFSPINLEDVNESMESNNMSLSEAMIKCVKD